METSVNTDRVSASFFLIAGPCVIENYEQTLHIARTLQEITAELEIGRAHV